MPYLILGMLRELKKGNKYLSSAHCRKKGSATVVMDKGTEYYA